MLAPAPIRLGRTQMTSGVAALTDERPDLLLMIPSWLARHARNDCSTLSDDDRAANDWAIEHGERVLTSWPLDADEGAARLWIITERDRSLTTVLLPSEY